MFRRLRRKVVRLAVVSGAGAAAAYFFDPQNGRARRAQTRDQVNARLRRRQVEAEREARYEADVAQGQAVRAHGGGVPRPQDDVDVAQQVRQALAEVDVDIADVTVESVDGVVTLRGQVASGDGMRAVEEAAGRAAGVIEVQSFLHTPGTPAPNKAASLRAS